MFNAVDIDHGKLSESLGLSNAPKVTFEECQPCNLRHRCSVSKRSKCDVSSAGQAAAAAASLADPVQQRWKRIRLGVPKHGPGINRIVFIDDGKAVRASEIMSKEC
jgi:hypothetical protein